MAHTVDWYYREIQQSIREAVSRPEFGASLPPLSDETWMKILAPTRHAEVENDRLEFLGDALMYATVGRQLFDQVPQGTPHLYSCVRAALHSNLTFAMLAEKLDIMAVSDKVLRALTRRTFGEGTAAPVKDVRQIKATADLFETVIAAYYLDNGFEALYAWVKEIYEPIINTATETFYKCRARSRSQRSHDPHIFSLRYEARRFIPAPRERLLLSPAYETKRALTLKKIKAAHVARRSPSAKASITGHAIAKASIYRHPTPPAKPRLLPAVAPRQASSSKAVIPEGPVVQTAAPIFVDLTMSDSEDEQVIDRPLRHPLVTPRIHRPSPFASKRPTPAPAAVPAADRSNDTDSESEEESMLENMLIADVADSDADSDMDCGSSDVETPIRPSSLTRLLTQPGLYRGGLDLKTGPPALPRRGVIYK